MYPNGTRRHRCSLSCGPLVSEIYKLCYHRSPKRLTQVHKSNIEMRTFLQVQQGIHIPKYHQQFLTRSCKLAREQFSLYRFGRWGGGQGMMSSMTLDDLSQNDLYQYCGVRLDPCLGVGFLERCPPVGSSTASTHFCGFCCHFLKSETHYNRQIGQQFI